MPHRPAQPGIDPRRRRPDALDQPAENDAIGFGQARFELAVDMQMRARRFRPPHHAVGERGLEHFRSNRPSWTISPLGLPVPSRSSNARGQRRSCALLEDHGNAVLVAATTPISTSRWRCASSAKSYGLERRKAFERRKRGLQLRRSAPAPDRVRHRSAASAAPAHAATTPRCALSLPSSSRKRSNSRASPPLPAGGRVPRNSASSSTSIARFSAPGAPPSRNSGCFSSASSVGGSRPLRRGFGREPGKDAGRRVHQRVAAGIVEFEIPARQRRHHPPRQRAVRRHQRRGLVEMPRLAHRDGDRERLHLGIGRLDHGEVFHAAAKSLPRSRAAPAGRAIAPSRSKAASPRTPAPRVHAAPARPRISTSPRVMPKPIQQRVHRVLRMVRRRRRGEFALRVTDAADRSARHPRRDRCRAPAAPRRLAAALPPHAGILRWPASSRSSLPRSPGHRDAPSGARLPPRSAGRAAPPVRSGRSRAR